MNAKVGQDEHDVELNLNFSLEEKSSVPLVHKAERAAKGISAVLEKTARSNVKISRGANLFGFLKSHTYETLHM